MRSFSQGQLRPSYFHFMENIIIIGSGCAGLTAAIYTARANFTPLVIEGTQPGGQITTTSEVENFPGFPEGVNGYDLTFKMRQQAEKFGTRFQGAVIKSLEIDGEVKRLHLEDGGTLETKALIVATGASPRLLGIPGEKEMYGGKGVSTCATCDGAFYRGQTVAVLGGGDSACEEANFITRFAAKVYLVHRRDSLRASKIMADRVLANPKIEMVWNATPKSILANDEGRARALVVSDSVSGKDREIELQGVFYAIGHIPNTQAFSAVLPCDDQGYFKRKTDSQVLTDVPGVFVAGDCADPSFRQAITAAGMGCQAAIEAERWLA